MRNLSIAILLLIATGLAPTAGNAADFLADGQFRYGMSYGEADALLAKREGDFIIQYRIDTASTNEIVCIYNESEFYRIRFFQGYCYFIERRAEAASGEIAGLFDQFIEKYGDSPEITQSSDRQLWYGRWMFNDRDIELTAYTGHEDMYILTYQEFDPILLGEALYTQEQEVLGGSVQVDPITGQPRLVPSEGEDGEAAESTDESVEDGEEESDDPPLEDIVDDGEDWGD
jgi:hypothetical protein